MGSFGFNDSNNSEYIETLQWLYSRLPMFSRTGGAAYKPGLETSHTLDNAFGNPHRKFRSIHIAGTNGKGSVSHTLAAILQSHGYKTALYTSPHLVDFRERMRINGKMIPHKDVIDFVKRFQALGYDGHPSFFELTMMMAFDWFARNDVDIAVIEVGMGGLLDSTNIITPEACVITNISFDHQQFLGATLPEIASQKAGIMKSGIPVIVGEAAGEVREIFAKTASGLGCDITFAEELDIIEEITSCPEGGWNCRSSIAGEFHAALGGEYQKKNIQTLLAALEVLTGKCGIRLDRSDIIEGFANVESLTGLRGRWTRISDTPLTICDTGHNQAGLTYNMKQLACLMKERQESACLRIVVGFVNDKAIDKILPLFPRNAVYYVCNADIPRALPSSILFEMMNKHGFNARDFGSVTKAFEAANSESTDKDIIFVGGSTFVVADFLAALDRKQI